jgi:hypothetical protein
MSGGSWDYFCFKMDDVVDKLQHERSPLRRAFGKHLSLCAKAMHDIEWADSGDIGEGEEIAAIKVVLSDSGSGKTLDEVKDDIEFIRNQLDSILER